MSYNKTSSIFFLLPLLVLVLNVFSCGSQHFSTEKLSQELNSIISTKAQDELVGVLISLRTTQDIKAIKSLIEQRGFSIYGSSVFPGVYAQLPKSFILELTNRVEVTHIDLIVFQ